ncbi:putative ribonuclease H-like domain-containing protein [Tanacetum coccineum]
MIKDQTCVACLKGKKHRASCKSKVLNPITKPLFMLHMDLFGPTFVSSLMHKKYYLVVTDDYSKFTWVFLTTKDETSEILKNFIKEIKNLMDKKVKIIKSDNGTEFKNKVMDDFCREKGIKREYSIAMTPQQNGVAERRNRTLIEVQFLMTLQVEDDPNIKNVEQDKFEDDSSTKEVNAAGQHVNTASPDVNTSSLKLNNIEPTSIAKALSDLSWVEAIQEELLQFKLHNGLDTCGSANERRPFRKIGVLLKQEDERNCDLGIKLRLVDWYGALIDFKVTLKTSHLLAVKRIFRYLKGKPTLGLWYSRDSPFELVAYTDSDYAGATQDRKSTTGGCQFLGNRLISWQCKKQTVVATSTTEAEYVLLAT